MKLTRVFFILLFLFMGSSGFLVAQKNHFIYIQTENKQPFYVKLDKKVFSSSISGYVIIPKLINGDYNFIIGFPKNEWPEQQVSFTVNNKDAGYLFKNFGERGWGFYNLQSAAIVMAGKNEPVAAVEKPVPITETVKTEIPQPVEEKPVVVPEKKPETPPSVEEKPAIVQETKTETLPETIKPEEKKTDTPVKETPAVLGLEKIEQTFFNTGKEGTELVYRIINGDKLETVTILIPAEKEAEEIIPIQKEDRKFIDLILPIIDTTNVKNEMDKPEPEIVIEKAKVENIMKPVPADTFPKITPVIELSKQPEKKPEKKPEENKPAEKEPPVASKPAGINIPNSNCKEIATEVDFIKLRRKMVAEDNDDDMVTAARKVFKTICFTTLQVKKISTLFFTDEGKYKLFDAAYPYVSDSEIFPVLVSELKETYFINRFKSMIHQ